MQKVKCPHCKKNIELSEVAKEQAKHLAAQEVKQLKVKNDADIKQAKKNLESKYAKEREKDRKKDAETIKELKASRKSDLEEAQRVAEKKQSKILKVNMVKIEKKMLKQLKN